MSINNKQVRNLHLFQILILQLFLERNEKIKFLAIFLTDEKLITYY